MLDYWIIMGVSGSGKSTLGRALANELSLPFDDADDFHPQANVDKMSRGQPLDDADRQPWFDRLCSLILDRQSSGTGGVLACSALKRTYRDQLRSSGVGVRFVYLHAQKNLLLTRMSSRSEHFMPTTLLDSQLSTLEEPVPDEAIRLDAMLPVQELVNRAISMVKSDHRAMMEQWRNQFEFDPTYGYDETAMRAITPPEAPDDFDHFWKSTFDQTMNTPLRIETKHSAASVPGYESREVYFDTLDGLRVGAWVLTPRSGVVRRGIVLGHGYGGRGGPGMSFDVRDTAWILPCAPGFHISAHPDIPGTAAFHVIHGIESRETYVIRKCVAQMWSALTVLKELVLEVGDDLSYSGESFGGGLGALALPWDARMRRGDLGVPTFGHHPIRLQCRCNGSGEAVRLYHQRHPEVARVLSYYDAAIAATRIKVPVLACPALFDPAVPPPGQFAVCNALAGPKRWCVAASGHFDQPGQAAYNRMRSAAATRWFEGA